MTASDIFYSYFVLLIFVFYSIMIPLHNKIKESVEMFNGNDFASFLEIKRGIAKSTITTRKSRVLCFLRFLDERNLPLSKQSVEVFLADLKAKGYKNSALNTYLIGLKSYELYRLDRGLSAGFIEGFRSYPEDQISKRALTTEEAEKLLSVYLEYKTFATDIIPNFLNTYYRCITKFLLYTGCRLSEAQRLPYNKLDLAHGIVTLEKTKSHKFRSAFLESDLVEDIRILLYKRTCRPDDLVFAGRNGRQFNQPDYGKDLRRRLIKAGIERPEEISAHNLRHTFASDLATNNIDLAKVGTLLGHSNIQITYKTYVHYQQDSLRDASRQLSILRKHLTTKEKVDRFCQLIEKYGYNQLSIIERGGEMFVEVKIL